MLRRIGLAGIAVLVAGAVVSAPATAATPRQPDLGMGKLTDFYVGHVGGQKRLMFSATIVNVGSGPFELHAARTSTSNPWSVRQRTFNTDGTYTDAAVDGIGMIYGGDGHGHWHIRDLENYELIRPDNGVKVGTGKKAGFCFFDTNSYRLSLPGAPQSSVYGSASCGAQDALTASMGLSVGWGDRYPWTLPDQYIDITTLDNGRYRLIATADAQGHFAESDEANNATWVDLRLSSRKGQTTVSVTGYGPVA